jgi:hypothetical protein
MPAAFFALEPSTWAMILIGFAAIGLGGATLVGRLLGDYL